MRTSIKTALAAGFILFTMSCTKENFKNPSPLSTQSTDNSTQAFQIGQSFGGGIIFYLDDTKQHGLIAAKQDVSNSNIQWYNGNYVTTNATGKAIGTGAKNTRKIVNTQGSATTYAALLCANYSSGGFNDWYLPSKNELNQLYKKRSVVGGFQATNYWSSTEADANNAWDQEFGGGFQFADDKSFTIRVRAIRSF